MDKLYIVIPAYNENENIRPLVEEWIPILDRKDISEDSKLVIVNDGSKDNTLEILKELKKEMHKIIIIDKPNSGHGSSLLVGYKYALKCNADYIFQIDSDRQVLPSEFYEFWEQRKKYDVIIGHRNKRQDGVYRVVITKTLKAVVRICFGVNVVDANTPFRLMAAQTLRKYINKVPKDFNLSNVLLSVLFVKNNEKVLFIPITFKQRQGGINSINLKKIFKIGLKALKDFKMLAKSI